VKIPPPESPARRRLSWLAFAIAVLWIAALVWASFQSQWPWVSGVARLGLACVALLVFAWLLRLAWRKFLWRVGRRLAFTYLLVGILPLGMFAILVLLTAYMVSGFLLGHLYRDAVDDLGDEIRAAAESQLADFVAHHRPVAAEGNLRFVYYRRGHRADGVSEGPADWPAWLPDFASPGSPTGIGCPFVALANGRLSIAGSARLGDEAVLAYFDGDLEARLRERAHVWLQLFRSDDPRKLSMTELQVLNQRFQLRGLWVERKPEQEAEYYRLNPPRGASPTLREKPNILWMETSGPLRALATGEPAAESVAASLAASPGVLFRALLSTSASVDSAAWLAFAGVAVLLLEIYFIAAAMASFMIFGISRAVNRLSRATEAVAQGDFTYRIPVKRKDQIGELQRSFNQMSGHLSELVATAALKEAIDKELALARRVQQDLLPAEVRARDEVEFATFFEPSAAIGGDYYDILDRPGGGLAVVIADVSGHGLPAGLRMAMVKSALTILIEDQAKAEDLLRRVHRLVRNRPGERGFVTATVSFFDPASGRLDLTNAGHPPTYLLRAAGGVEELLLPGPALGTFEGAFGRATVDLAPGDSVVWLSDGIIEGTNESGEQFGYDRVQRSIAGAAPTAAAVRDRLLAAARAHSGSDAPEDDRTIVVLRYLGAAASSSPRNE
jgi:serine phosphatase RsbU (regulator of sigma subunit)